MTDGLKDAHREAIIAAIAANDRVERAVLFGSRATGTNTVTSDVDIALFGDRLTLTHRARLTAALEEIPMAQTVDLILYDSVRNRTLREHIRNDGVEWFEREYEPSRARSWPMVRLGDHADACLGKMLDQKKNRGELFPYLGNKNVRWGSFDTSDLRQMRFGDHEHDRYGLKYGDLVVCEGGEPGRCAIWKDEVPGMKIQKALHRIRAREQLDNRFLHYWFLLAGRNGALEPYFTGTTIQHLTGKAIAELQIPLPPKPEQRAIAHVLGTLDDKIELNRRMSETLEAMARALFKSWFVNFDPVRAKMEGRDTGLPQDIADLFPDRLVDSEMGEIPDGWEVSQIGDEVDAVGGSTPSTKEPSYWHQGDHYWATPKDLSKLSSPVLLDTNRKITDAGLRKISSRTLPVGTVLLSSRAPIGYLAIAEIPTAVNQGFIAMRCERRLPNLYVLYWCEQNLGYIRDIAGGSTFAEISKKTFRTVSVIVPSKAILGMYQPLSRPLYNLLVANVKEAATLAALRDTLLPKLISGEIRIGCSATKREGRNLG